MGQGVVPNLSIAEFEGYWIIKQRDFTLTQVKG